MKILVLKIKSEGNSLMWNNLSKKLNKHDFFYKCSKDNPGFLFENFRIIIKRYEQFPCIRHLIYFELKIKIMFNKNNGKKRRKLNMNKHKAMKNPDHICQKYFFNPDS